MEQMRKHFVTFYSPGTFVAEETTKPIESWDPDEALRMAASIEERYDATPYGFRFSTRARTDEMLDSRVVATSGMYFFDVKVETLEEIEANPEGREILRDNMKTLSLIHISEPTRPY